jgi:hypothetical protein
MLALPGSRFAGKEGNGGSKTDGRKSMFEFILQHQFWAAVGAYWVFSAAVSALPEPWPYRDRASRPSPDGSTFYVWLYQFVHTVAGNITTVFGGKIPGLKPLAAPMLVLCVSGCATMHYSVHPGALNPTDSAAYDMLLIAQATIEQAKADYQDHQLPPSTKGAINTLVQSYTVARESWLTYRGAIATNVPSDQYFQQLNKNLSDLITAIQGLKEVKTQ